MTGVRESIPRDALEQVVHGLFDYAGTFPPESKRFEDALETSARFSMSLTRPWLVAADFVLAIQDLDRLALDYLEDLGFRSFRCAVLGSPFEGSIDRVQEDLGRLVAFNAVSPRRQAISYEVRAAPDADIRALATLARETDSGVFVAIEPDLSGNDWPGIMASLVAALQDARGKAVLKVRGSGPTAIDNHKLARIIAAVSEAHVDLKATAGMHHPILEARWANDFGFLNVVSALLLRRRFGPAFSDSDVFRCLTTSDPGLYAAAQTFSWNGWELTPEEIAHLKDRYRFTIGSCSIQEPDADLARLFGPPAQPTTRSE